MTVRVWSVKAIVADFTRQPMTQTTQQFMVLVDSSHPEPELNALQQAREIITLAYNPLLQIRELKVRDEHIIMRRPIL